SPWAQSMYSLPSIIYQTDQRLEVGKGETFWRIAGKATPSTQVPSVFREARDHGYRTALIGHYLPYPRILGDQVDDCRSVGTYGMGKSLPDKMLRAALRNLNFFQDPVTESKRETIRAAIESRMWVDVNQWMLRETMRVVDAASPDLFAFFHWSLP